MGLKDKASKIGFSDLDEPSSVQATTPAPPGKARSGVAAITQTISMHHRVQDLEAKVAEYEDASIVVMLDPKLVKPGKFKNRDSRSFLSAGFLELKAEIEAAGRNVQPIKVRRLEPGEEEGVVYEVVYGRRRLQACLELGLLVSAVVGDLSDLEVFQEMERENRNRADLSAWEQGMMYRHALEQGLYASQRQLAAALNVNAGNLSTSLKLANLPTEIVDSFSSPLDLQFRWASDLSAAFEKSPAKVIAAAEEIKSLSVRPPAKEVLGRLTGTVGSRTLPATQFKTAGKVVGAWSKDGSGNGTLRIRGGVLTDEKEKKLIELVNKLLDSQ